MCACWPTLYHVPQAKSALFLFFDRFLGGTGGGGVVKSYPHFVTVDEFCVNTLRTVTDTVLHDPKNKIEAEVEGRLQCKKINVTLHQIWWQL